MENSRGNNIVSIENKYLYAAYKDLTPSEFAVWLYCLEYQMPDKAGILRNYGISERSYKDAIRGLKDKKYLEGTGKNMIFHICPKPIEYNLEDIIANISEKQKIKLYNEIKPKDRYTVIK